MESIVFGKPILHSVLTLKSLIENFKMYAESRTYSDDSQEDEYEKTMQAIDLMKGSMSQIELAKSRLQTLIDEMKDSYDSTKSKEERKALLQEFERIEQETGFNDVIKEAVELHFMLGTRLTEAVSNERRLERKLGIAKKTITMAAQSTYNANTDTHSSHEKDGINARRLSGAIPPPKIVLPPFLGNEGEFPEFWAMYETLVHNNPALTVVEKMLLLKESLQGKSDRSVRGIQLLPQNYDWMIESLHKKYGNKPANRARIVKQLNELQKANRTAESCEFVYDNVCMLLNQMFSAGQDIRSSKDALWAEAILSKFPHDIVEPVLMKMRESEDLTIDAIMEIINDEIAAKAYIQSRIRSNEPEKTKTASYATKAVQKCLNCERNNHNTWQCQSALSVSEKRAIVARKRLCWKCYSSQHSSAQCSRNDCRLCGKMHHIELCFANESAREVSTVPRDLSKQNIPALNKAQQGVRRSDSSIANKQTTESAGLRHNAGLQQRKTHNINMHVSSDWDSDPIEPENISENDYDYSCNKITENHTNIEMKEKRSNNEQIALKTAEGCVWNHDAEKFERVVFFFDTGAQKTVIQEDLAMKLKLPKLKTETCVMSGIGGKTETFKSNIVHLKIGTAYGKDMEILIQTKPILTNGFPAVKLGAMDQQFLESRNLLVCNPNIRGEYHIPHILVGLDHYYTFVIDSGEKLKTPSGLRIANTIFGPTVYGRGSTDFTENNTTTSPISYSMTAIEETERELLNKLFKLEGLGISSDESSASNNFYEYFKQYSQQISIEKGYVTAPFPLKNTVEDLSDNCGIALKRLISLQLQLEKNPNQKEWYCKTLEQYETGDIIERVFEDAPNSVGLYYMPHSGVWRPHKPKPLRIVFDASSKRKGQLSLNDVMHKGEALVNKIHDILIASRTSKIIMLCDIEAAFTQIRLQENHRDLCRFLWLRDVNKPPSHDNVIQYRFKRVPFGAKPSPSILNMCLLSFLQSKNSALSKEIVENLYVDNILLCANTPLEALEKYRQSKALLAEIGMNLREYVSNSNEVNSSIPQHDRAPTGDIKLLGVMYNTDSDELRLEIKFARKEILTKRDIVSQLNSIYDPVGLAGPLTIRLKHLMREIYDSGIGWKDAVPAELAAKWNGTCQNLNNISVSVPRYSFDVDSGPLSLWTFADASAHALATCAFLRDERTLKVTHLTSGKTRLTPKRMRQTTPKLEMLATLMAIRLGKTIVAASKKPIKDVNILSDSEIALSWIMSSRALPIFVESQKCRIIKAKNAIELKGLTVKFWYVPTACNPADAGTRFTDAGKFYELPWIVGPQWLSKENRSSLLKPMNISEQVDAAIEKETIAGVTASHVASDSPAYTTQRTTLLSLSRFSRFDKAVRTIARVCKTLRLWIIKVNEKRGDTTHIRLDKLHRFSPSWFITGEDFSRSETIIFADAHESVSVKDLQKRFPQKKLFRDEAGVIRNQSRLQSCLLPYDAKNPIYVDKDSDLARLVLTDIHYKNAHSGKDHTLCIARTRFWIPRPSSAFKKFVRNCVTCKKWQGLPFGAPEMPPLPKDRVVLTRPFENIGCDFMGPFQIKENKKCYICLYTCLTTRAIHLETVEDMSTSAFLNSFKRFAARRGIPKLVRKDCGSNFKLGHRVIETILMPNDNSSETCFMSFCAEHKIQWIFNPPGAPWMGGAWERLVGTVKRAFNKAVGRRKLTYSDFLTVITEIEAIVNTRPHVACSSNVEEIPLRPVDFIHKSLKYSLAPLDHEEKLDPTFDPQLIQTVTQAREALAHSERVTEIFWERWHSEYLTALRELQKVNRKQSKHQKLRAPKVNEIVLVEQENLPRVLVLRENNGSD